MLLAGTASSQLRGEGDPVTRWEAEGIVSVIGALLTWSATSPARRGSRAGGAPFANGSGGSAHTLSVLHGIYKGSMVWAQFITGIKALDLKPLTLILSPALHYPC
jgi:hypothetical protein